MSHFFGQYHVFISKIILFARNIIKTKPHMVEQKTIQVSEIRNNLAKLSADMETIISDTEPEFLQLGNELQSIFGSATGLSHIVIQSGKGRSDSPEDKILSQISGFAQMSVDRLEGCRNEIAENLTSLEFGKNDLEKLIGICRKNEQLSILLNVIALNLAVESNRTKQSSEMFIVFAQEIKQVAENMKKIAMNLYTDSQATCTSQEKIQAEIAVRKDELTRVTRDAETVVAEAIGKIDQLSVMFETAMQNGIRYSKEISDQVAEIVMAIQFHDIVRQQMEHVVHAIQDAERICAENNGDTDLPEIAGKIHRTLMVQAAQIQQVMTEIDSARKQILQSFENIEIKAANLASCLSESLISQNDESGQAENPFEVLICSLEDLNRLIIQAYDLKDLMSNAASEASSSIAGLAGHTRKVQDISLDLHRKALNAIIKSAHLGRDGATFEILAQEVTSVSQESNLFADKVTGIIDSVSRLADKLQDTSLKDVPNEITETEQQKRNAGAELQKAKDAYQLFQDTTSQASRASRDLEASIQKTKAFLSFLKTILSSLSVPLAEIENLIATLSPLIGDGSKTMDMDDDLQRYTMESERIIHTRILDQHKTRLNDKPEADEASDDTLSEEEDNIDLFDDTESDSEAIELFGDDAEEPPPGQDEQDDNLELFETVDAVEKTALEKEDNIELFDDADSDAGAIELFAHDEEPTGGETSLSHEDDQIENLELFEPIKKHTENTAHTPVVFEEEAPPSADKKNESEQEENNIELF